MVNPILNAINKTTAPLRRRVQLMIGRAVIAAVGDGSACQTLQVTALSGEVLDGVERIQEYGFTSHPHQGAEAVLLAVGGNRSHGLVVVAGDRRYRLTGLAAGEVALHDDQGQVVHFKRDCILVHSPFNIEVNTDGILRLEGDGVEIHGRTYVQTDVHGKGQRETWTGGVNYH